MNDARGAMQCHSQTCWVSSRTAIATKGLLILALMFCYQFSSTFAAAETTRSSELLFERRAFPQLNLEVDYTPADARWVDDVVARTDSARRILNKLMPDALLANVRVVIAPTKETFLALVGGWAEHSAAVALRTRPIPTIVINADALRTVPPVEFSRTLLHELVHCYLGLRLKTSLPRWFEEGVAVIAADEVNFDDAAEVAIAALLHRTIPLRELAWHFPSQAERQRLAYRQSASVVRFLMNEQGGTLSSLLEPFLGPDGERRIAELWNPLYLEPLELRWKHSVISWQSWVIALSRSGSFWVLVALLTVLAWYLRKQRSIAQRRQWEEEERIYGVFDEDERQKPALEEREKEQEDGARPPWYGG
ncbi:MAG: hypothetical protein ACP5UB_07250 [Candidatus Sumerlaeaceae bacterium]